MYEKCTLGYLTKRKKAEILWIVFFVVLGVAIFLTGYLWSGVRANIFTVRAVLLVLPAAKHLVALIAMFRKKGVTKERYDKVKTAAGQAVLYTDYVFTSTEKIMHLDFLLVKNGNVLGMKNKEQNVFGTYIHGIFDEGDFGEKLINKLKKELNIEESNEVNYKDYKISQYDKLCELLEENIDMPYVENLIRS